MTNTIMMILNEEYDKSLVLWLRFVKPNTFVTPYITLVTRHQGI